MMRARTWFLTVAAIVFLGIGAIPRAEAQIDNRGWEDVGIVFESPDGGNAYFPSVIFDLNGFSMKGLNGSGKKSDYQFAMWYSDGLGNVFRVRSKDGFEWKSRRRVRGLGGTAHHVQVVFDANCFGAPSCGRRSIKYKMWYWNFAEIFDIKAIYYAESRNGLRWRNAQPIAQNPSTPLVTGLGPDPQEWNAGSFGPINIIYQPDVPNTGTNPWDYSYVMHFDGTDGAREVTGLAYSPDGFVWTAFSRNPVLGNSPDASWDCSDSVYGTIFPDGDGLHYWYSGGGADEGDGGCLDQPAHQGIGHAFSTDGLSWVRDQTNPIFHITDGDAHRDGRTYTPAVVDDGSGTLRMYYSAQSMDGGPKKIGLALLP